METMDHMGITLNCDMGEGFGMYSFGHDAEMMEYIDVANVACGAHASDFNHMRETVRLAARHNVRVGAHPSLPDLQGFGRREMKMTREELANCLIFQIGALSGFLKSENMVLNHIKPHGALYGMAAREEDVANAVADAADVFQVPLMGLPGTLHESIYNERGHSFMPEYFVDLEYDDDGTLLITRKHAAHDLDRVKSKTRSVLHSGHLLSENDKEIPVTPETICVHSDTPNAVEIARTVSGILRSK